MKKSIITITLALLCTIICSCEKEPQDLLIGRWEVKETIEIENDSDLSLVDSFVEYWTFEKNGIGKSQWESGSEMREQDFKYKYDKESDSIIIIQQHEDVIAEKAMEIVELTKKSFALRYRGTLTLLDVVIQSTETYEGKRIE